jgi:hypothetical protein
MSLLEAVTKALAERMGSSAVSSWQKASDLLDYQRYLRLNSRPHRARDLCAAFSLPATRVSEMLRIAIDLDVEALAKCNVTPELLQHVEHRPLLRIARLPYYLREKQIRDAIRDSSKADPGRALGAVALGREAHRTSVFRRMREEGDYLIEIAAPVTSLTPQEARAHLDDFLPALANLAELVMSQSRSHYIALAGNGGLVIYLAPPSQRSGGD